MYYSLIAFTVEYDGDSDSDSDGYPDQKLLEVVTKFSSREQFENISDAGYDMVSHLANEWSGMPINYHIEFIEDIKDLKVSDLHKYSDIIWDLSYLDIYGWPYPK